MILIDTALAKCADEGRPVRVGMIGAGFMARGIALQIAGSVTGMEIVAICNRTLARARQAYEEAGQGEDIVEATNPSALVAAIEAGKRPITDDPSLITDCPLVDVVLEATGSLDYGAQVVSRAIDQGKHVVLMNAELDGTVGPLLKSKADKVGVVYTNVDGDQPGVMMNLYRYVKGIGARPVMCGNIKGLHDPYRNPTTQEGFAKTWRQDPAMVTSFADGTKISFEQAITANACGFSVLQRGMMGLTVEPGTQITEAVAAFPQDRLLEEPGWVDYMVGPTPAPGVFVLGEITHPLHQHLMRYYKMGDGPLYCFYTPYHLCHFEVPFTIARAALFADAAVTPLAGPEVEVIAQAKTDLKAGDTLDGLGEYMTYGIAENATVTAKEGLLPIGLAQGCKLKRDIAKDAPLLRSDVIFPENRMIDQLRAEQDAMFGLTPAAV